MAYERVNWLNKGETGAKPINKTNLNKMDKGIYDLQNVEIIAVTDTTPTECAKGEKYFNTIDNLIYTATDTNTWGETGEEALRGILYVVISSQTSYYYNGTTLISIGGGSGGASGDTLPIGSIVPFGGENVPTNWLLCDGSMLNREAYPELFEAIGTSFGTDGPGNFYIPDLRGRVIVGQDTSDADFGIGLTGGEKTHTLTVDEMPRHNHSNTWSSAGAGSNGGGTIALATETATNVLGNEYTGGGKEHNNLQPYTVTNYIIKAKQSIGVVGNVVNEKTESDKDTYSCDFINGTILYESVDGTIENITLNDNVNNYSFIEIYYNRNNLGYASTKIEVTETSLQSISLMCSYYSSDIWRMYARNIAISGTSLTNKSTNSFGVNFVNGSKEVDVGYNDTYFRITKVIGYK